MCLVGISSTGRDNLFLVIGNYDRFVPTVTVSMASGRVSIEPIYNFLDIEKGTNFDEALMSLLALTPQENVL